VATLPQSSVRIEQSSPEAIVERRTSGVWKSEKLTGLDAVMDLPEVGVRIPLAELYERLRFSIDPGAPIAL
jgi:hypothetical protein